MSLLEQRVLRDQAVIPICLNPAESLTAELAGPKDGVAVPRWMAELAGTVVAIKCDAYDMAPALQFQDTMIVWFGPSDKMQAAARGDDIFVVVEEGGAVHIKCTIWSDKRKQVSMYNLRDSAGCTDLSYNSIKTAGLVIGTLRGWVSPIKGMVCLYDIDHIANVNEG